MITRFKLFESKIPTDEDDLAYLFSQKYIGTIMEALNGITINGYHINDEMEGEEEIYYIRGNWFPDVYEANDEEIEKYEMYKNAEKYNL